MLDSTHFDHNNEWVHWTVGTSSDSHPRRHRVPIALTQTLGLSQARPPAVPCVDFSHLTGRPQSKHFLFVPSSSKAAVRCSTQFDQNNECDGLSARISIKTVNDFRSSATLLSPTREKRRPWSRCLVSRKSEGGCAREMDTLLEADRVSNSKTSD